MARITLAGESLIAQKQGAKEVLRITRFIYANVPGLDPAKPIDRAAAKPPAAQIVHTYEIPTENSGYVNPNQVVYSSMLGSDIGDFDWNWMGLESAEGVLFAVAYLPLQQKRRNIPPVQIGNNVTRNILVEYSGAQELTGISIDANTWQHDFTVRLAGIDERERLSNREVYGRACFLNDALQVTRSAASGYYLRAGVAYIEGVRIQTQEKAIVPPVLPITAWLDVALERQMNDVVARWEVVFSETDALSDWQDALGVKHYRLPLANLTTSDVVDRRGVEVIDGPLIKHFASARSVAEVRKRVSDLEDGTTPAGKANRWATARRLALLGDASGQVEIDGSMSVGLRVTLTDTGVQPGAWAKPVVNAKGQVIGSQLLIPGDIPSLDWSKITSGKPTTVEGYGILNALRTGNSDQVPHFHSPIAGTTYQTTAMEIREVNLVADATKDWQYAPRMSFHWKNVVAGTLAMDSTGLLRWNDHRVWTSGNFDPESKADKGTTLAAYGILDGIKRGEAGLATSTAPVVPIDSVGLPGGFYSFTEGPTSLTQYCSVLNIPYASSMYSAQLAFQQGTTSVRLLARSTANNGNWTPTVELYHSGNLDPQAIVPAGSVVYFAVNALPAGYLRANGAAVSRTTYARLFATIGTTFGAGDGASTFHLPDLRGVFLRGLDDGRGIDPGRGLGGLQYGQNASHTHTASIAAAGEHSHVVTGTTNEAGAHSHIVEKASVGNNTTGAYLSPANASGSTSQTSSAGSHTHNVSGQALAAGGHSHAITINAEGNEARPINLALLACIKF
ncbi:phage tail protein [Pseudomonas sp. RAC1]|uniref:phage tail-collar fiber domain-containing protein n=1 Tax=Pseudomonas sp. RAC1 TaxID=3064900 RepID=UPI00271ED6D7|nr:phage tail protein [Pseudomonas sp. RAC1]MDV9030490.1 phage tail protein [Pseudomonas sp. RAC1]